MMPEPLDFFQAMLEKFHRKAEEKGKTLQPWQDFTHEFLMVRPEMEYQELLEASGFIPLQRSPTMTEEAADELLDIANFCMFIWMRFKGGQTI